jgi:hypothetical protein
MGETERCVPDHHRSHGGHGGHVVLGWGLGVESTAILTRWLLEPDSRDFGLDELTVLTALTGDEFARTHADVEAHMLPLLRQHQVRWVQVSRAGQSDTAGIAVVDDSRSPTVSHTAGPWRLSDELARAGTVPQYAAGRRLCSIRAKGSVLDRWIDTNIDGSYRHVIGFSAEETSRVLRDRSYSGPDRTSEYPLVEWGWTRSDCVEYLRGVFSVTWAKSCCEFCPFRGGSTGELISDWAADPGAAFAAVLLERRAMALNPAMTLYPAGKTAVDTLEQHSPALYERIVQQLACQEHALVEVRRILPHAKADVTKKAPSLRATTVHASGSAADMEELLAGCAARHGGDVTVDRFGIARVWHLHRRGALPDVEWLHCVAPAGTVSKARTGFDARWDALLTQLRCGVAS